MNADHIPVHHGESLALEHLASGQHGLDRDHRDILRRDHTVDRRAAIQAHATSSGCLRKKCGDEITWHAKGIGNAFGGRLIQTTHCFRPSFSDVCGVGHILKLKLNYRNRNLSRAGGNKISVSGPQLRRASAS